MAYTVIPLQIDEHREALRRLWRDNSYDPETNVYAAERFDWLYRDTGASDAQTWLAVESESRRVIGCGSVFRSNRTFRGQIVAAGVPAVFFVDREHRLAGAALGIQRAVLGGGCRSGLDVFVGKPNRSARAICDRVGYRPVGDLQEWVRVVWGDDSLSACPRAADYADEIVSAADERFDLLWDRAKKHYPMAAQKTAAFLNWRYAGFKENYRFYCVVRRDDCRLVAGGQREHGNHRRRSLGDGCDLQRPRNRQRQALRHGLPQRTRGRVRQLVQPRLRRLQRSKDPEGLCPVRNPVARREHLRDLRTAGWREEGRRTRAR